MSMREGWSIWRRVREGWKRNVNTSSASRGTVTYHWLSVIDDRHLWRHSSDIVVCLYRSRVEDYELRVAKLKKDVSRNGHVSFGGSVSPMRSSISRIAALNSIASTRILVTITKCECFLLSFWFQVFVGIIDFSVSLSSLTIRWFLCHSTFLESRSV